MSNWKHVLKGDPTGWLLEESNPSVRYFALRWLLDKPQSDPEVVAASQSIAQSEPVQNVLKRQKPEGYWGPDPRPHHGVEKYMIILLWLGYRGDGVVKKAMDYLLDGCILEDGAYGVDIKGRVVLIPCHAADALRLMLWYGHDEDPRARKLLGWLMSVQDRDGGWPCVSKAKPISCFWATAAVLQAFQDLPSLGHPPGRRFPTASRGTISGERPLPPQARMGQAQPPLVPVRLPHACRYRCPSSTRSGGPLRLARR
jgi:hypothetical protein